MNKPQMIATLLVIAIVQVILTASLSNSHQKDTQPNDNHIALIISHLHRPNLYPNVTQKLCGFHSWYVLETNEDGSDEPMRYAGCDIQVYEEVPKPYENK